MPLDGRRIGEGPVRAPHRHDYHELLWIRSGEGEHLLDGTALRVVPGAVTLIGRGQVHVFRRAEALHGAVVRFGDEALGEASWLLAGRGGRVVGVPPGEVVHLEAAISALAAEGRRPPDIRTAALQRHLLAAVLGWIERWHDAAAMEVPAGDGDAQLHRRFVAVLERDFARHHDAGWYADALAVPAAALSKALAAVTGRTTKELVLDRVMLEAARLLRFTDLTVGEVSFRVGFRDPLYFSRAFKRHAGEAPMAYRARVRGEVHGPARSAHPGGARPGPS